MTAVEIGHALVTGAGGFLGRSLCERLLARGVRVTALHRHPRPGPWSRELLCDLARSGPLARELSGIDTVFHLAGHAHADERPGSGDLHRHTSIDGTRRLLDGCGRDVRRLLFVSSVKAMCERTPAGCVDETARPAPTTAYGRARLEAERLVLAGAPQRHVVVLRLPLVYGAGARGNLARMLAAIDRGRMPLLPEFRNRRSLVHVGDVAEGAIAAVRTPACSGRVYLLTDGDPYSTREIQVLMFGALGRALPRRALPRRALGLIARAGDGLRLLGVRSPPLDSAALARLAESACFRDARARADFGYAPHLRLGDALPARVRALRAADDAS